MRCSRARRLFSAYLDGEIDSRRRASLESHLATCQACADGLGRLEAQWDALGESDPAPPLPSDLWQQVMRTLDQTRRLPWHCRYRTRLVQAACVMACVILGFAGGALLTWRRPPAGRAVDRVSMGERRMVAEAFDATAFGISDGKEGLLQCVPR